MVAEVGAEFEDEETSEMPIVRNFKEFIGGVHSELVELRVQVPLSYMVFKL